MRAVHRIEHNADIFYPEDRGTSAPYVIEIGHSYPPHGFISKKLIRDVYVLHYISSGKGMYQGQTVEGPCLFLETPQNIHYYTVDDDKEAPDWEQYWIMFSHEQSRSWLEDAGIPPEPVCTPCPYMHKVVGIFSELFNPSNYTNVNDGFFMLSGLCKLLSLHSFENKHRYSSNHYVKLIREHIHKNYDSISDEAELAELVHLSVRYMHKLFKSEMGMSPMKYLNQYRIERAKVFLVDNDLSVKMVSEMVGYSTPDYFCRVFKKFCNGVSPLRYKKGARL